MPAETESVVWTRARDRVLLRDRRLKVPVFSIFERLNKMPGLSIEAVEMLGARISVLRGVGRSIELEQNSQGVEHPVDPAHAGCAGVSSQTSPPAATPAVLLEMAPMPGLRSVVSYEQAKAWAAKHGLCERRQALDLNAVNAARRRLNAPPFALAGAA
jgi:hypothetical protein